MNPGHVKIILKKEFLSFIKNKEALLVMFVVPIFLYPMLMLLTSDLLTKQIIKQVQEKTYIQFIASDEKSKDKLSPKAQEYFNFLKANIETQKTDTKVSVDIPIAGKEDKDQLNKNKKAGNDSAQKAQTKEGAPFSKLLDRKFEMLPFIASQEKVKLKDKQTVQVIFTEKENKNPESWGQIAFAYDSRNDLAMAVLSELRSFTKKFSHNIVIEKLKARGISEKILDPIDFAKASDIAPEGHTISKYGSNLFAIMLIVFIYISCQYAATEVLPAEKEQKTLETLIATPLLWREIIFGKYLAVIIAGIANGLANLVGIGICGFSFFTSMQMGGNDFLDLNSFSPWLLIAILLLMLPLAMASASLALLLVSFAKSRMSASYFSIPGLIVVTGPTMMTLMPNIQLQGIWYFVPFANITLLFRNCFINQFQFIDLIIVLISLCLFTATTSYFTIRISNRRDKILGPTGSFSFNRPIQPVNYLGVGESLIILAISFGLYYSLGSILQSIQINGKFVPENISLSMILFLFLPGYFYLVYRKINIKSFLQLNGLNTRQLLGSLLAFIPLFAGALILGNLQKVLFPDMNSDIDSQIFEKISEGKTLFMMILIIAVTPAIFEEFVFRGIVLNSLKRKLRVWESILFTGILFSIAHLSIYKLIPIIFLGSYLTYVAYISKSILPSVILHFLNNAFAVSVMFYTREHKDSVIEKLEMQSSSIRNLNSIELIFAGLAFCLSIMTIIGIAILSFHLLKNEPSKAQNVSEI